MRVHIATAKFRLINQGLTEWNRGTYFLGISETIMNVRRRQLCMMLLKTRILTQLPRRYLNHCERTLGINGSLLMLSSMPVCGHLLLFLLNNDWAKRLALNSMAISVAPDGSAT